MRGSQGAPYAKVYIYGDNYSSYSTAKCDKNGNYKVCYKSDPDAKFRVSIIEKDKIIDLPDFYSPATFA